jgi:dihydrofolate reductase
MGELVTTTFLTLDGVMQGPGGPEEDREGGFDRGGWQAPFTDDDSGERMLAEFESWDAYLLGRRTYDIFASFWPHQADGPFTRVVNGRPRYVPTSTLTEAQWEGTTLLHGDLATEVATVKERHDRIGLWGSATLVQSLLREDLVDRLDLWIYPVVLGKGKRLFAESDLATAFRPVETAAFEGGGTHLVLERTGRPTYATMGDGS